MLRFDRKQQNPVKQLSFNKKKLIKKKVPSSRWRGAAIQGVHKISRDLHLHCSRILVGLGSLQRDHRLRLAPQSHCQL